MLGVANFQGQQEKQLSSEARGGGIKSGSIVYLCRATWNISVYLFSFKSPWSEAKY